MFRPGAFGNGSVSRSDCILLFTSRFKRANFSRGSQDPSSWYQGAQDVGGSIEILERKEATMISQVGRFEHLSSTPTLVKNGVKSNVF